MNQKEFRYALIKMIEERDLLTMPSPVTAMILMTSALALSDAYKANCGYSSSTTEEEWVALARDAHKRLRTQGTN